MRGRNSQRLCNALGKQSRDGNLLVHPFEPVVLWVVEPDAFSPRLCDEHRIPARIVDPLDLEIEARLLAQLSTRALIERLALVTPA